MCVCADSNVCLASFVTFSFWVLKPGLCIGGGFRESSSKSYRGAKRCGLGSDVISASLEF